MAQQSDTLAPTEVEVVVVGAGPTGLAAAIALGRLGVDTLLLERRVTTSTHPRGHVENGRTMELFRLWGVEQEVRAQGLPYSFLGGVAFMTRMAGIELGRITFSPDSEWLMGHDGKGPAGLSSTPQDRLEPILLKRAQECDGVTTRFGCEVTDLVQDDDWVTVTVRDQEGKQESIRAKYAFCADGPRSATRGRLGIGVDGPGAVGSQLGIYFHADLSDLVDANRNALYWLYNPQVQGVIISLDGNRRWHLLFGYDATTESIEDYPPQRCEQIVRGLIGRDDGDLDIRSVLPWRMRGAVAQQFGVRRVFLGGDAAHTMPPTGGMGMNTGIGDAHNLAWKLHAVLRGIADPALLETYATEREPVGRRNTENSLSNARTMVESGLAGIMVSDPEGFAAIEAPQGAVIRDRIAAAIPGQLEHFSFDGLSFGYAYESAAITPDGTPPTPSSVGVYVPSSRPGSRAPHAWLLRHGKQLSTIDLSDGRIVVLSADRAWVQAAQRVAQRRNVSIEAFLVGAEGADLVDTSGSWAQQYGVGSSGAVLIRPDGHVAWRCADAEGEGDRLEQIEAALDRLLCREARPPHAADDVRMSV